MTSNRWGFGEISEESKRIGKGLCCDFTRPQKTLILLKFLRQRLTNIVNLELL